MVSDSRGTVSGVVRSTGDVAVYLERPAIVTTGITNKHNVGLKQAALVLLNEDISQASPNAKMGDIWFALEPGLIGSGNL